MKILIIPLLLLSISALGQEDSAVFEERMPIYQGCEDIEDRDEQTRCTERNLISFVQKNVVYPEDALENGDEGKVYIGFVVNKEGDVEDVKILRGVTPSIDQAAINSVKQLPKFTPAYQDGKNVKLKYTIPVNFKLMSRKKKKKKRRKD